MAVGGGAEVEQGWPRAEWIWTSPPGAPGTPPEVCPLNPRSPRTGAEVRCLSEGRAVPLGVREADPLIYPKVPITQTSQSVFLRMAPVRAALRPSVPPSPHLEPPAAAAAGAWMQDGITTGQVGGRGLNSPLRPHPLSTLKAAPGSWGQTPHPPSSRPTRASAGLGWRRGAPGSQERPSGHSLV